MAAMPERVSEHSGTVKPLRNQILCPHAEALLHGRDPPMKAGPREGTMRAVTGQVRRHVEVVDDSDRRIEEPGDSSGDRHEKHRP
ncbi:hypothetical protein GCM10022382_02400 [Microbacterium invictum]